MNAVLVPSMPGLYAPARHSSVRVNVQFPQDSVTTVEASSRRLVRGDEIVSRVLAALAQAGQDGVRVRPAVFARTLELLQALPPWVPLPEAVVESEGEIGLDWDEGAYRVVSLTVRETPQVGFAALFGTEPHYGRMELVGEIPETLNFLLARLFPPSRRA